MSTLSAGISLCMIVRDEERFLRGALESVAGVVDEICIVDTGSRDRTREIAAAFGARVRCLDWDDDFAAARNAALAMARRRWILVLDADERLEPRWTDVVRTVGRSAAALRGKWINCRNLTDEHKGSGAMSHALVRLFPNHPRIRYRNPIHEFVTLDDAPEGLPSDSTPIEIVHHGYLSAVIVERAKGERNLRLSRRAAEREPDDPFQQYNLGMASLLCGDRDGAIAALDRARELTRTTPRGFRVHALVVLADLYADHRQDSATARRLVDECLALVPTYSNAHFAQGKLLARAGEYYEARNAFGRAIAAGAHDAEHFVVDNEIAHWKAACEIGATLMHERRFGEALRWFELAAHNRPGAQALTLNRARCHEALGELGAAGALFAAAFEGYADQTSAVEWINFLLRRGRTLEAAAAADVAVGWVEPATGVLLLGTAAAAHLRDGRRADAAAALERALELGSPPEVRATLTALAFELRIPELLDVLEPVRAPELRIAYGVGR